MLILNVSTEVVPTSFDKGKKTLHRTDAEERGGIVVAVWYLAKTSYAILHHPLRFDLP